MGPVENLPGSDPLLDAWSNLLYTLGRPDQKRDRVDAGNHADAIPVTVLSGFLGAGKTTLVCELLTHAPHAITAVVNDIAAINIDAQLVRARSEDTIELGNGCACCVLGDDFFDVLDDIAGREERPVQVVMEASGIADPTGIAQTVENHPYFRLDGIITVVDVAGFLSTRDRPEHEVLFDRQLEAAHLVVLRGKETLNNGSVLDEISKLVPGRPLLWSEDLLADSDYLVDILSSATLRGARLPLPSVSHDLARYTSRVIQGAQTFQASSLMTLLNEIPVSVLRIKGWVRVAGRPICLQAVGSKWRFMDEQGTSDSDLQLVVIGIGDDPAYIRFCTALKACLVNSE